MSTSARYIAIDGYPQQLRVNFMKMQVSSVFPIDRLLCASDTMSTLISYAKAFGIGYNKNMSQTEIAVLVANHFVSSSIEENKVIHDFYTKTENVKRNPTSSLSESSSYTIPKRQSKKPKKYTQLEESTSHYNTRSRAEKKDHTQHCSCGKEDNDGMVECDNPDCKHQWFHYECVGIENPDDLPKKWYCPECQKLMNKQ